MKVISFSIFDRTYYPFELGFYMRGLYFNVRMAKLLYPDWSVHITVESQFRERYLNFFKWFEDHATVTDGANNRPLCEMMLWRMLPLFDTDTTHVICRDTDAILTYKEAQLVHAWVQSDNDIHMMLDNPAHSGLMGGMVGFKGAFIRNNFVKFNLLTKNWNLNKRGSDQDLLNNVVLPKGKGSVYKSSFLPNILPGVNERLWESNLTCRHIGSAGAVDMEVLRFFKRFDKTDYSEFESSLPDIFYWTK
jgi:hypothetical protein